MTFLWYLFNDCVEGCAINLYVDRGGRYWMAKNQWGWFRVRSIQETTNAE